jgi:membrane protein YqaA with SNARE-associated domain
MLLWLSTFLVGIVTAIVPVPIEVYIAGAATQNSGFAKAVALGLAAGGGATIGKVVWYLVALKGSQSRWMQKKLAAPKVRAGYDRWVGRMEGRPVFAGGIIFLASSVGLPPLLAMAAVAGFLRMPLWVFVPTVFVGRTLRFTLIFLGVDGLEVGFL